MVSLRLSIGVAYLLVSVSFLGAIDWPFSSKPKPEDIVVPMLETFVPEPVLQRPAQEPGNLHDSGVKQRSAAYLLDPTRQKIDDTLIKEILLNCPEELLDIIEA